MQTWSFVFHKVRKPIGENILMGNVLCIKKNHFNRAAICDEGYDNKE